MPLLAMHGRWANAPGTIDDPNPPPPPPPPPGSYKAPVTGVGPRSAGNISGRAADIGFVVADCDWQTLQPTEGGPIVTSTTSGLGWNQIETARANNLPYRLRVHCGDQAPSWAKNTGGAPMTLIQTEQKPGQPPPGAETFTCGRWWTAAYLAAWGGFMQDLAALLEDDPLCREVASHPATTHYAEPFQRGTKPVEATAGPNAGKTNVQVIYETMIASGVSAADAQAEKNAGGGIIGPSRADKAAMLWPTDLVTVGSARIPRWRTFGWETTRFYIPFNPFQQWEVTNAGSSTFAYNVRADPGGWTATCINTMSTNMRAQVVVGNNSLRAPLSAAGPAYTQLYKDLTDATASANGYQTATQEILTQQYDLVAPGSSASQALATTIRLGLGMITEANDIPESLVTAPVTALRGRSIELPPNWQNNLSAADAATFNNFAAGNPTGS